MATRAQRASIRLQLQNLRQTVAGLAAVRGQVAGLQTQTASYNRAVTEGHRRTWLMNQALFTLRRFAYAATLTIAALGAASVVAGVKFNISMEQNNIAMSHFLGSSELATEELDYLFELAARTPFEFQQVVNAERRFLAFGFSVDEARQALSTIGDVAAGLGGDPADNIERLVLVLGQVRATGRVLGQDMLQLQQLGINTNRIFREELGLTREDLSQGVGELQIPAEVAIPALLRGMQKQFEGMAEEQSKTLGGMLSTLHDYTTQLAGSLTMPIFDKLRGRIVPDLISVSDEMNRAAKEGASWNEMMEILDRHLGDTGIIAEGWEILANVGASLGAIFTNIVVPGLKVFGLYLKIILPALSMLSGILLVVSQHSRILGYVVMYLTALYLVHRTILVLNVIWTLRQGLAWKLAIIAGMRFGGVIRFTTVMLYRGVVATRAWAFATIQLRSTMGTFLSPTFKRGGLLARGIRFIWLAVAATRAWAISNLFVGRTFMMIPIIGWLAAIITAVIILEMKFHFLQRRIEGIWDLLIRFRDWITGNKMSWDDFLPDPKKIEKLFWFIAPVPAAGLAVGRKIAGAADGGFITSGGMLMVGERGPELVTLPTGARVRPTGESHVPLDPAGIDLDLMIRSVFEVDGEKLEEKLAVHRLNKKARR